MISNHLSYLDIVVFAALHPCVFVSKAEIQELAGCGVDDDDVRDGLCGARSWRVGDEGAEGDAGGGGCGFAGGVLS